MVLCICRRILKQTVVGVERENAMQETHELYDTLKQFMSKLPNHTVKEKLNSTQVSFGLNTNQVDFSDFSKFYVKLSFYN